MPITYCVRSLRAICLRYVSSYYYKVDVYMAESVLCGTKSEECVQLRDRGLVNSVLHCTAHSCNVV